MTERYRPALVLVNAEKGCACCGVAWWPKHMVRKDKPRWQAGPLAVCRDCLQRFVGWLEAGTIPDDKAENFVFFTWLGYEAYQRGYGIAPHEKMCCQGNSPSCRKQGKQ